MNINAQILATCDCLNRGWLAEANKHLNEACRSFHYGTGKDDLDWTAFENMAHVVRAAITRALNDNRPFNLTPIDRTNPKTTVKRCPDCGDVEVIVHGYEHGEPVCGMCSCCRNTLYFAPRQTT